jgi:hypothetical protein
MLKEQDKRIQEIIAGIKEQLKTRKVLVIRFENYPGSGMRFRKKLEEAGVKIKEASSEGTFIVKR